MMMNTEVIFIRHILEPRYDPITHEWPEGDETEVVYLNVTSLSYAKAFRDYGVTNSKMQVIRSLTEIPEFDEVDISGIRYVEFSRQRIGNKESIILKEKNA
ncbi:hypothetical protein [Weissella minor]|uniref:Uncharacterized protein n=1 Tax=Weissella minor TaxID=1620 RepID=A0A0R2JJ01_9LACO|nr:hypothetical protein [Weissella minor]KRN77262.1 hypothetical protein IV67_GL000051 [Weissella minor]